MSKSRFLTGCAWAVHFYTALGAVAGLLAFSYIARGDWRGAFTMMAIAVAIDASDGPIARALRVRERIPYFDGALLDNIVDYLTYVAAPVFLMLRAQIFPDDVGGEAVAAFVMIASAYGFSRTDAKTVAYDVAKRDGVRAASRKVFLDDKDIRQAIIAQIELAAHDAKRDGFTIAIGHPRPATIAALAEEVPQLASHGVHLVFASDVVH